MNTPLPGEAERERQLVTAKRRATLLLLASACAFLVLVLTGESTGWRGFLIAAAEGSLVGGLADWFAVTALFGRPLGLPIPHTAIVVERKNQFAGTFADFVQSAFLRPELIEEALRARDPVRALARWLEDPQHVADAEAELAEVAALVLQRVEWDQLPAAIRERLRSELSGVPWQHLAQEAWAAAQAREGLDPAVDRLLAFATDQLGARESALRGLAREHAPWWLPGAIRDRLVDQLIEDARGILDSMAQDRTHPLRRDLERRLVELGTSVLASPNFDARANDTVEHALGSALFREWLAARIDEARRWLSEGVRDPASPLRQGLRAQLIRVGRILETEPELRELLEARLYRGVRAASARAQSEFRGLAARTIEEWDPHEAARRLQLLMGADLQHVRINGTIVGGLAGLLIQAIAEVARYA